MAINFQQTDTAGDCNLANVYCSGLPATEVLSGNSRQCSDGGSAGSTSVSVTAVGNAVDDAGALFGCTVDAGVTWAAGTWTVRLNVTTANMNLTWASVYICRVNSSCVSQESLGSSTALGISLSTTGVKSTTVSGSAATPSAGDKIVVVFGIDNGSMTAQSFSHTPNQLIDSPFAAPPPYPWPQRIFQPIQLAP